MWRKDGGRRMKKETYYEFEVLIHTEKVPYQAIVVARMSTEALLKALNVFHLADFDTRNIMIIRRKEVRAYEQKRNKASLY